MRISDWSSDVCSSDLWVWPTRTGRKTILEAGCSLITSVPISEQSKRVEHDEQRRPFMDHDRRADAEPHDCRGHEQRSEERRVGEASVSTCRSRWSPDD